MAKINIVAPVGGYGNHARWLMALDPGFTLRFDDRVLTTTEQKVEFIEQNIYFAGRTWHNWLEIEWRYREAMNAVIRFAHSHVEVLGTAPTVVLTTDPELAYRSYLKFNSNLNTRSRERFLRDVASDNHSNIQFAESVDHASVLHSDVLFQPTLHQMFYRDLISFFGLQDQYQQANHIHQLWYRCHRQAEQEFVHDIAQVYK
jgi:hypothetical protein